MAFAFQVNYPISDAELERLSREHPGVQFERDARGELIVSPVGTLGGSAEMALGGQLWKWACRDGRGFAASSSTGFTLPDGSVLCPDAAWVSYERWRALPAKARKGYAPIAPDVAFEFLSPSDGLDAARAKASAYLANGVLLVVLLDPRARLAELHRPGRQPISHVHAGVVPLDPELPGFRLDAGAIFDALHELAEE